MTSPEDSAALNPGVSSGSDALLVAAGWCSATPAIDLVLTIGMQGHPSARRLQRLSLEWIASPEFALAAEAPVPLIVFSQPCRFKQRAIEALDQADRPWKIVFSSPSLGGLWAATRAGIGVTIRSLYWVPQGLATLAPGQHGLPVLGDTDLTIHYYRQALSPAMYKIAQMIERAVLMRGGSSP